MQTMLLCALNLMAIKYTLEPQIFNDFCMIIPNFPGLNGPIT